MFCRATERTNEMKRVNNFTVAAVAIHMSSKNYFFKKKLESAQVKLSIAVHFEESLKCSNITINVLHYNFFRVAMCCSSPIKI